VCFQSIAELSEDVYERMNYYALRALSDVARWAAEQRATLEHADIDSLAKRMMRTRLGSLAVDEVERQFPHRARRPLRPPARPAIKSSTLAVRSTSRCQAQPSTRSRWPRSRFSPRS
jgi:hypothetical protein